MEVQERPPRKEIMHDYDLARMKEWLGDEEMPEKLRTAYFKAQLEYHQKLPGAMSDQALKKMFDEAMNTRVVLPKKRPLPLDAGDRLSKNG
jgi:hypothetical protein